MFYGVLSVLFAAVFIFILWRVLRMQAPPPAKREFYVCPRCGERHCECHKRGEPPQS